jgi:opacity protein-like surface antigen
VTGRPFAGAAASAAALAAAALAAACASDTLVFDGPNAGNDIAIAPYEIFETCATLATGDRIDYRFEAKAPVAFEIYYKEGITFVAPVSRSDVMESGGIYRATLDQRYCLRWEAGQQGALVDYRVRLQRGRSAS